MICYAQINTVTQALEQCVAFGDAGSFDAHREANTQAFFVAVNEWCSPRTHRFDVATGALVKKAEAESTRVKTLSPSQERREKYSPSGEQLDAIWKALRKIADAGVDIGAEAAAMLTEIEAVKAQHPVAKPDNKGA